MYIYIYIYIYIYFPYLSKEVTSRRRVLSTGREKKYKVAKL